MDQVFSISQLNGFIRDIVQSAFPMSVWVTGEIQNYDRAKSRKHVFFELVEKSSAASDIIAKIGLVIFDRNKAVLQQTLKQAENSFELKDDIEVKFLCRVDFYAPHGAMRLIVEDIDPIYTLGKLAQDKQQLIAALKAEGLVDLNKQHEMPLLPLRIGLITAYDSAAYHDFCNQLNASGFGFQVFVADAVMQGKRTESTVVKAFNKLLSLDHLDIIVLSRGGGSLADLAAFDSRVIAETIARSPVPVLTGIGHEINTSVADIVAHSSAKTPTAAAQMLIQQTQLISDRLDRIRQQIEKGVEELLIKQRQQLKDLAIGLRTNSQEYFSDQKQIIQVLNSRLMQARTQSFKRVSVQIEDIESRLHQSIRLRFERLKSKIDHYSRLVHIIDPANTLRKGYSITRTKEGKLIRDCADVKSDQIVLTQLADGMFESTVSKIIKE